MKNDKKVRLEWDDDCEYDSNEKLFSTEWNKQVENSWRVYVKNIHTNTTLKNRYITIQIILNW